MDLVFYTLKSSHLYPKIEKRPIVPFLPNKSVEFNIKILFHLE